MCYKSKQIPAEEERAAMDFQARFIDTGWRYRVLFASEYVARVANSSEIELKLYCANSIDAEAYSI